jgi:uncharacterized membrane protein
MMALSIEVGRFFFARSQIAAAADAASLSAAIEINKRVFVETGEVILPTSETYVWAQRAVNANCSYLIERGINPRVSGIVISGNTVQVSVSADLSLLFPSIVPDVTVTETGKAEVRALKR